MRKWIYRKRIFRLIKYIHKYFSKDIKIILDDNGSGISAYVFTWTKEVNDLIM